jgi:ATP phosphoribosyltransferase regulatory subunit
MMVERAPFPPRSRSNAGAAIGERLLAHFEEAGFARADVALLQPAEPFLELSGEEIRRRLFLTLNAEGQELCLRPEFTIPAALAYLSEKPLGRRADLAFFGPVFRHRPQESGEFLQLGIESIGRLDEVAADADLLGEVFEALSNEKIGPLTLNLGDLSLFSALLSALGLEGQMRRRLSLALADGKLASMLAPETLEKKKSLTRKADQQGLARYSGVLDALKGADPAEARAFVKDLMAIAGVSPTGTRSAEDIAARFLERAQGGAGALGIEQAAILRKFFAISGDPDQVALELRALAREAKLDLDAPLERFELRTGFMEARGLPIGDIHASMGFSRNLDYYSGFVFDLKTLASGAMPVAAGGRYDRLFERLGNPVPALGAAIWVARLNASEA